MAEWDEIRERLEGYNEHLSSYPPGQVGEDIEAALERIEGLEQIASGNHERLELLQKKYGPGLSESEETRLSALQELIAAVIPSVTPGMLSALAGKPEHRAGDDG